MTCQWLASTSRTCPVRLLAGHPCSWRCSTRELQEHGQPLGRAVEGGDVVVDGRVQHVVHVRSSSSPTQSVARHRPDAAGTWQARRRRRANVAVHADGCDQLAAVVTVRRCRVRVRCWRVHGGTVVRAGPGAASGSIAVSGNRHRRGLVGGAWGSLCRRRRRPPAVAACCRGGVRQLRWRRHPGGAGAWCTAGSSRRACA